MHRRNQRGTWHHRMGKTKCWRCEVAEKIGKAESSIQVNWEKFLHALQYTCFCHYRGYDDDEDPYWRRMSQTQRQNARDRERRRSSAVPAVARRETTGLPSGTMGGESVEVSMRYR